MSKVFVAQPPSAVAVLCSVEAGRHARRYLKFDLPGIRWQRA
jgi:hypothetical protein